jgi:GNAT superfamily N-acetyltransferase
MRPSDRLLAFAEDPSALVGIGPDEERLLTVRYCVIFAPGEHFWSTAVSRVRFANEDDVLAGVAEIRCLMTDRGRSAAAWTIGPSATPTELLDLLLELGMQRESEEGSVILVLTRPPSVDQSPFRVARVRTFEEHLASIEVSNEGFELGEEDALDERRRAEATFEAERAARHSARLLAFDGDRPIATGRAWLSPIGFYLGGGATIPSHRRRGAMSALVAAAWEEATRAGTPALVTFGGALSAPILQRIGFRPQGTVHQLIDRMEWEETSPAVGTTVDAAFPGRPFSAECQPDLGGSMPPC